MITRPYKLLACVVLVVASIAAQWIVGGLTAQYRTTLSVSDMQAGGGHLTLMRLEAPSNPLYDAPCSQKEAPSCLSPYRLFENDRPLGPQDSAHADIRELGGGRYSHWGDEFYFSASDNSDPRTNGKTYVVVGRLSAARWVVWALGLATLLGLTGVLVMTRRAWLPRLSLIGHGAAGAYALLLAVLLIAPVTRTHVLERDTFTTADEFAYTAPLPALPGPLSLLRRFPDSVADPDSSRLVLLENSRPLPTPHAQHSDIRQQGHGRYSDWNGNIFFSTSDNSDPRSNGRVYSVREPLFPTFWQMWLGVAFVAVALCRLAEDRRRRAGLRRERHASKID